jgi:hypothetical protein
LPLLQFVLVVDVAVGIAKEAISARPDLDLGFGGHSAPRTSSTV